MTPTEQAIALRAEAVAHKRMERHHRRRARELMEQYRAFCEQAGIRMEVKAEGGRDGHTNAQL